MAIINGTSGNNTLNGTASADTINGLGGDDTLNGQGGNDTLDGGSGNDLLRGGLGNDIYIVDSAGDVVTENITEGTDTIRTSVNYTLSDNVENLVLLGSAISGTGNLLDNTLTGNDQANYLYSGGGNDTLNGGLAQDRLYGGDGDDTLRSGGSATGSYLYTEGGFLYGEAGNDILYGDNGYNLLNGGTGNDIYHVGSGITLLVFNNDWGTDTIISDSLSFQSTNLYFEGVTDGLTIDVATRQVTSGSNTVTWDTSLLLSDVSGGNGNDIIYLQGSMNAGGNDGNDTIYGGDGNSWLRGQFGNDTIYGNDGDDRLWGEAGNDYLYGGTGNDTYMFDWNQNIDVIEDISGNADLLEVLGTLSALTNIEARDSNSDGFVDQLVLSIGYSTTTIRNYFDNTNSDFKLSNGGSGLLETFQFSDSTTMDFSDVINFMTDVYDFPVPPLGSISGNNLANTINGTNLDDVIYGFGGNDIIRGLDGNDVIYGGLGANTLRGGNGNDVLYGSNEGDVFDLENGSDAYYGGTERDIYFFMSGFASDIDIINDQSGLDDIYLYSFVDTGDVTNWSSEDMDSNGYADRLVFQINNMGTYKIDNYFDNTDAMTLGAGVIETFTFSDVTWGFADIIQFVENYGSTAGYTIHLGTSSVTDYFYSAAGNDWYIGRSGADSYNISNNWGNDVIVDSLDSLDEPIVGNSLNMYTVTSDLDIDLLTGATDGTNTISWNKGYTFAGVSAGSGNDLIDGTTLKDILTGNDGNDILYGHSGNDVLEGGYGNDSLYGGDGNDTIYGDVGLGIGNDYVNGGLGDDSYHNLGVGHDIVEDEGGNDYISIGYSGKSWTINLNASEGVEFTEDTGTYTIDLLPGTVIEQIVVHGDHAFIIGNDTDNIFKTRDGNDTMYGGLGNDILNAGSGNNLLYGGDGNDSYGSIIEDLPLSGSVVDYINDSSGSSDLLHYSRALTGISLWEALDIDNNGFYDSLRLNHSTITTTIDNYFNNVVHLGSGLGLIETISFSDSTMFDFQDILDEFSIILGTSNNDVIQGTDGNDEIYGNGGNDTFLGGLGNDTYIVDNPEDNITENINEGVDTVRSTFSYTLGINIENLVLLGSASFGNGNVLDNVIIGNTQNNIIYGYDGNDTLDGKSGNDQLYGGIGDDIYIVDNVSDTVIENGSEGIDTIRSSVSYNLVNNTENIVLLGSALNSSGNSLNNSMVGNDQNNWLNGQNGDDILDGGLGNDQLYGGLGNDALTGGDGIDSIYGNDGDDLINADAGNDYIVGGAGIDTINGGDGDDQLWAQDGDDILNGGSGNDLLEGGAGNDAMSGGAGDDAYRVYQVSDTATENAGEGTDTVYAQVDFILGANIENLIFMGAGNLNGTGNAENNSLTGTAGNNTLDGGDGNDNLNAGMGNDILIGGNGNDFLYGGGNADTMTGGFGNDTYHVDNASDVVTENAAEGIDSVQATLTHTLAANVENLYLQGTNNMNGSGNAENNTIVGNSGNNVLFGYDGNDYLSAGAGNDSVLGGNGNDTLIGGLGNDTLYGELGNDSYLGLSSGFGDDLIIDMGGVELIDLSSFNSSAATWTAIDSNTDGRLDRLQIDLSSGDSLLVSFYFNNTNIDEDFSGAGAGYIEEIRFSDTSIDFADVQALIT